MSIGVILSDGASVAPLGSATNPIVTTLLSGVTAIRSLSNSTTVIAGGATVTLATVTRDPTETLFVCLFVSTSTAGVQFSPGTVPGADGVRTWFERTAVADEVNLRAQNVAGVARTLDWNIIGITP